MVIPVLLDVLKRFMETDIIVVQVLITLASYGRTGEQQLEYEMQMYYWNPF